MTRLARVVAIALVLAAGLVVSSSLSGAEHAAADTPIVKFTKDDTAKTITITVKIAFYVQPPLTSNDSRRPVLDAAVKRIQEDIATFWANQYFLCYKVVVEPTMRVVDDGAMVGSDEVGVRLDPALVPVRKPSEDGDISMQDGPVRARGANVIGSSTHIYLSELPDDRLDPLTGPPTTDAATGAVQESSWPVNGTPGLYSHELGHILGLDDNYVTKGSQAYNDGAAEWSTLPGAADDMMRLQGQPIDPTTITRLIRRSGQIDEKSLKCSMKADLTPTPYGIPGLAGGTVGLHMWTCQLVPPSNQPSSQLPMTFSGTMDLFGELWTPFGGGSGSGTVPVTTDLFAGDPLFTVVYESSSGRVEVNQALSWLDGRPRAAQTFATLTQTLPIGAQVVFSDDADECG